MELIFACIVPVPKISPEVIRSSEEQKLYSCAQLVEKYSLELCENRNSSLNL